MTKRLTRILLKISGESLIGAHSHGVDLAAALKVAKMLKAFTDRHVHLSVVMGGGNWLRGTQDTLKGMERTPADQMGMLATIMNGLALEQALTQIGAKVHLFTALSCPQVAETFTVRAAKRAMEQGEICLFVGGTGNPYFTTDSAAALRSCELQVDALCKATKVDGLYSADPLKDKNAVRYPRLSYEEVLKQQLKVMDATAVTLCMQQNIPIYLFHMSALEDPALLTDLQAGHLGSCIS